MNLGLSSIRAQQVEVSLLGFSTAEGGRESWRAVGAGRNLGLLGAAAACGRGAERVVSEGGRRVRGLSGAGSEGRERRGAVSGTGPERG